jgi:hypothetical protein
MQDGEAGTNSDDQRNRGRERTKDHQKQAQIEFIIESSQCDERCGAMM